jgi:Nucleotidyl transferase AbiEii toxin, Type IV TA system
MTGSDGRFSYSSAQAFRAALRDRLAASARAGGHGLDELQRQFAYDRLLARAFSGPEADRWVLKGAGALLARLPDARHSRDIDLAYSVLAERFVKTGPRADAERVDAAAEALKLVAERDIGDFFRFEITKSSPLQEAAKGRRLHMVAYLGARYAAFQVDIVALAAAFLDPVLNGTVSTTWNPATQSWIRP